MDPKRYQYIRLTRIDGGMLVCVCGVRRCITVHMCDWQMFCFDVMHVVMSLNLTFRLSKPDHLRHRRNQRRIVYPIRTTALVVFHAYFVMPMSVKANGTSTHSRNDFCNGMTLMMMQYGVAEEYFWEFSLIAPHSPMAIDQNATKKKLNGFLISAIEWTQLDRSQRRENPQFEF